MTISSSTGLPLSPQPHRYLTEIPEKISSKLNRKALMYNIASKVAFAAILALSALVLSISFLGASIGISPFLLVGLTILTPFLAMGASRLMHKSNENLQIASLEKGVADELKKISNWSEVEIQNFFNQHRLNTQNLHLQELAKLSPQSPLKALLPLIARFYYFNAQRIESEAKVKATLESPIADPDVRLASDRIAWQILENKQLPYALSAAFILSLISNPTSQLSLSDIGSCRSKDLETRLASRHFRRGDDYFVFTQSNSPRAPLSLESLQNNSDPTTLYHQLFLPQIRV